MPPAAAPMAAVAAACKERGLWPFVHFNRLHVVPPCTTTAAEIRDQARAQADAAAPRAFALFDAWWAGVTGPA